MWCSDVIPLLGGGDKKISGSSCPNSLAQRMSSRFSERPSFRKWGEKRQKNPDIMPCPPHGCAHLHPTTCTSNTRNTQVEDVTVKAWPSMDMFLFKLILSRCPYWDSLLWKWLELKSSPWWLKTDFSKCLLIQNIGMECSKENLPNYTYLWQCSPLIREADPGRLERWLTH